MLEILTLHAKTNTRDIGLGCMLGVTVTILVPVVLSGIKAKFSTGCDRHLQLETSKTPKKLNTTHVAFDKKFVRLSRIDAKFQPQSWVNLHHCCAIFLVEVQKLTLEALVTLSVFELSGPLNRLNAVLSLLQPLDRYRTHSAIGSAIGKPLSRPISLPRTGRSSQPPRSNAILDRD